MRKHFVEFLSPGTFVAETTVKAIDAHNVDAAVEMARSVTERYGARPYGFRFVTRERGENDFDSRETFRSGVYYLGGKLKTLSEVETMAGTQILASNMRCNGWDRVIVNDNSWRWVQPFEESDVLLEVTL